MTSSSGTTRDIGTLIVVVLKANHLPNKRHIGKQDPYCVCMMNGEKQRTKAIKRGGQHPEWDEEFRFQIREILPDVTDGSPPTPPPKGNGLSGSKNKDIQGGMSMKLACYADDPREPDLIGETEVDLTEVLTKGESDEWFTLQYKDRFAGKVYLELTFWSNETPPEKKPNPVAPQVDPEYGGKGHFIPSTGIPSSMPRLGQPHNASTSVLYEHSRLPSDVSPSGIRSSTSLAQIELYNPVYDPSNRASAVDALASNFGELGVGSGHRRESFPPVRQQYTSGTVTSRYSSIHSQPTGESYAYGHPNAAINGAPSEHSYEPYSYEQPPQAAYQTPMPTGRGPRYSIPSSSSGFMPIQTSGSALAPLPSHASEPAGFPQSHTPAPLYNQSHFLPPGFPASSQTPMPAYPPPPTQSSISGYSPSSFTPQSYHYPYTPAPPPQPLGYVPEPGPLPHQQAPYPAYGSSGSPAHESTSSPSRGPSVASRPLPQPQVYGQAVQPAYNPEPPGPAQQNYSHISGYQNVPPPPPLPAQPTPPSQLYPHSSNENLSVLPPPPPSHMASGNWQSSLPVPPLGSHGLSNFPQPLPPPPPPIDYIQNPPPAPPPLPIPPQGPAYPYYPGPPPKPPAMINEDQWQASQGQHAYSSPQQNWA